MWEIKSTLIDIRLENILYLLLYKKECLLIMIHCEDKILCALKREIEGSPATLLSSSQIIRRHIK